MQKNDLLSKETTTSTTVEDLITKLKLATIDTLTQPTDDQVLASVAEVDAESRAEENKPHESQPGVCHDDEDNNPILLNMMPGSFTREQFGDNVDICCNLATRLAGRGITATAGWCVPEGECLVGFTGEYLLGFYDGGERKIQVTAKIFITYSSSPFCFGNKLSLFCTVH